ncbi:MAG TPA: YceD family protein [Dokdonella sp.]
MSAALPDRVDVARQVQAQRTFDGSLPLASMQRLRGSLANTEGEARYSLEFGRDSLGIAYLALRVEAALPLVCQRTLETFAYRVALDQRLGLIASEGEEAALPEGYEPLLVPDGQLDLADVIEDELILALPVVPLKPGAPLEWKDGPVDEDAGEQRPNPFAVLGSLKKH